MHTEYEATFFPIDISDMRSRLIEIGAICTRPLFTQMRTIFECPEWHIHPWSYARVRDEGNRVTMTWKQFLQDGTIESQKEIEIVIDSYTYGIELLLKLWCTIKAVQETRREIWEIDGIHIMLDQWPFLDTLIEIEWTSEPEVKKFATQLWLDRSTAWFDSITPLYASIYSISEDRINKETPVIKFDMKNPFL